MKKLIVLGLVLPLWMGMARAGEHRTSHNSSITTNDDSTSDDCREHLRVSDDDYRSSLRDEEIKTIPNQPLTITGEQNGGISIKDCGGEVTATVENGGLSITLPDHWEGKGLEAHARNGGLVVSVPKTFNGGLEVVASEHTSIICKDEICQAGERTWDNGHKLFRLGGSNPQIRATTDNGGIVIAERGHSRGEL